MRPFYKNLLFALGTTFYASISSNASAVTIIDTVDPVAPMFFNVDGEFYSYQHNILTEFDADGDDSAAVYNPQTDTLTSAMMRLSFSDGNQGNDALDLVIDAVLVADDFSLNAAVSSDLKESIGFSVDLALLADGLLDVTLTKVGGRNSHQNYYFHGSELVVDAARALENPLTVAEPTTLALLGFGLGGLSVATRRRKKH